MTIKNPNYDVLMEKRIDDLNSMGYILKHKKSGARVVLLSNDDSNKVFNIGFKTPPYNDTGLPHILEHSVLCGSAKYPAKDPFVELCKGSLNTFLNAMTYPDKTVYPVASCNDVDFKNIVDVYMDAVFHPNIYNRKEIFCQEGWHYEMESADGPLTYNGVVYNEMKGAFSDPDDLLSSKTFRMLFPDNEYGNESGGDPDKIPTLTYEEFLEFHKKYYHPSNSYIYLYGDMDMEAYLAYLDEEYLCQYDAIEIPSAIKAQKAFEKPVDVTLEYAVTEEEEEEENAYLSYNTVVGTALDRNLYLAFQILDYALIGAPGAPVKKALIQAGLGKDVYSSYENSIYQPMFSIIAKNADEKRKDEFVATIRKVLGDIVSTGMDEKALLAGINHFEFKYREADFGPYPKGLMYGLQALDSWLYDDMAPFMHIEAGETFEFLKSQIHTGYFENLIQTYLIDNTHAAIITMVPKMNLTAIKEEAVRKELEAYKATLSKEECQQIVADTRHLKTYQEEPSTQEELMTIPMLERKDIGREPERLYIDEKELCGIKTIHSNLFTNKIAYLNLSFDCRCVPQELIPYEGLLRKVLGYVDTKEHEYGDLFHEIQMNCGGITSGPTTYTNDKNAKDYTMRYEFHAKVLYSKIDFVFDTILEMIQSTNFEDYNRIREILEESKSRMQSAIVGAGHYTIMNELMGQFSESIHFNNLASGLQFYQFICDLIEHFDEKKQEIAYSLTKLTRLIFDRNNLILGLTMDEEGYSIFADRFKHFVDALPAEPLAVCERHFAPHNEKIGYMTSAQVNYVGRCGNFMQDGFGYTGAFRILKTIFGYEYLWVNVRVKGGAYGCMSGFAKSGEAYLVSYRDPNIRQTNEIYEHAVDFIRNFTVSERDMTKYVIGTIGEMDTPLNPMAKGNRSFSAYMSKVTVDDLAKIRKEIIEATQDDIRKLYEPVQTMLSQNYFGVVGNAEQIKEQEALFDKIVNLL